MQTELSRLFHVGKLPSHVLNFKITTQCFHLWTRWTRHAGHPEAPLPFTMQQDTVHREYLTSAPHGNAQCGLTGNRNPKESHGTCKQYLKIKTKNIKHGLKLPSVSNTYKNAGKLINIFSSKFPDFCKWFVLSILIVFPIGFLHESHLNLILFLCCTKHCIIQKYECDCPQINYLSGLLGVLWGGLYVSSWLRRTS